VNLFNLYTKILVSTNNFGEDTSFFGDYLMGNVLKTFDPYGKSKRDDITTFLNIIV